MSEDNTPPIGNQSKLQENNSVAVEATQNEDDPQPHARSLGRAAARGMASTGASQGVSILLQALTVVVLSRLITPQQFGLYGMVIAIVGVGEIIREMGLSTAAIQAKTLSRGQRDNIFWISVLMGLTISLAVALSAPLLMHFYHRHEILGITYALAPTFLISSIASPYRAQLTRNLRFKRMAIADIIANCGGVLVAITTALLGWGYWSLVSQAIVGGTLTAILYVALSGWLPRWYDRSIPMRSLLNFGWAVLAVTVITYLGNNSDSMILGRRVGAAALGSYSRGLQLVRSPMNQLRTPIQVVAMPILARVQSDKDRFVRLIDMYQIAVGYPFLIALGWIISCAPTITALALGPQWSHVTPLIRLISFGEMVNSLMFVASWMYAALGLARQMISFTIFDVLWRVICILIGSHWGVIGVGFAYAISPLAFYPLAFIQVQHATQIRTARLMLRGATMFITSLGATAFAWWGVEALKATGLLSAFLSFILLILFYGALSIIPQVRGQYLTMFGVLRHFRKPPVVA